MKSHISSFRLIFGLILITLLAGCGSSMMMNVEPLGEPPADEAVITFMRPSMMGGAIRFGLWDSQNLVGVITAGSMIEYKAKPGEHLFMAKAENWSLVKANLDAGKKYYVVVRPQMGIMKSRVKLDPITKSDDAEKDLEKWLQKCQPIAPIPEQVDAYVKEWLPKVKEAITNYEKGDAKAKELGAAEGR